MSAQAFSQAQHCDRAHSGLAAPTAAISPVCELEQGRASEESERPLAAATDDIVVPRIWLCERLTQVRDGFVLDGELIGL